MKSDFKINQIILHKNGWREKENTQGQEYFKPLKKSDFPRLHLVIEPDKSFNVHIDQHRRHGFISKWLFGGRVNITGDNATIREEVLKLKIDVFDEVLEKMRVQIHSIKAAFKNN